MYQPDLEPGAPTLLTALTYITEHPERHDQEWWITLDVVPPTSDWCGTTACVAGTVALLHGWAPKPMEPGESMISYVMRDGEERSVRHVAQNLLRLKLDESEKLFFARNTLKELWYLGAQLFPGEITVPTQFQEA